MTGTDILQWLAILSLALGSFHHTRLIKRTESTVLGLSRRNGLR